MGGASREARHGATTAPGALVDLFRYSRWATLQLIDACRGLTEQRLDARAPGTSGSIRELLVRVVGGQQPFILRTKGRQHEGDLGRGRPWPGLAVTRSSTASSIRTEISVTLTHLGIAHPDLDGWPYSAAAGYGRRVDGAHVS